MADDGDLVLNLVAFDDIGGGQHKVKVGRQANAAAIAHADGSAKRPLLLRQLLQTHTHRLACLLACRRRAGPQGERLLAGKE
jgi:hypothetical protein